MSLGSDEPAPLGVLFPPPVFPLPPTAVWALSFVEPVVLVLLPLPEPAVALGRKVVPLLLSSESLVPPPLSRQVKVLVSQVNPSLQHPVPHLASVVEHLASHFLSGKHLTPAGQQESLSLQGE